MHTGTYICTMRIIYDQWTFLRDEAPLNLIRDFHIGQGTYICQDVPLNAKKPLYILRNLHRRRDLSYATIDLYIQKRIT